MSDGARFKEPDEDALADKVADEWADLSDGAMLEALIAWLGPEQFKLFEEQWQLDRYNWHLEKGWIDREDD